MIDKYLEIDGESALDVYTTNPGYIGLQVVYVSGRVLMTVDECDVLIEMLEEARGEVYESRVDDRKPEMTVEEKADKACKRWVDDHVLSVDDPEF